jgi:hypothetical protein
MPVCKTQQGYYEGKKFQAVLKKELAIAFHRRITLACECNSNLNNVTIVISDPLRVN